MSKTEVCGGSKLATENKEDPHTSVGGGGEAHTCTLAAASGLQEQGSFSLGQADVSAPHPNTLTGFLEVSNNSDGIS